MNETIIYDVVAIQNDNIQILVDSMRDVFIREIKIIFIVAIITWLLHLSRRWFVPKYGDSANEWLDVVVSMGLIFIALLCLLLLTIKVEVLQPSFLP